MPLFDCAKCDMQLFFPSKGHYDCVIALGCWKGGDVRAAQTNGNIETIEVNA
jgi:hypothetical protein